MLVKMFSIYDSKVPVYKQPFFMRSRGEAMRALESEMKDTNNGFYRHAEDFVLFELGEFDDETCELKLHSAPQSVIRMIDIKSKLDLTSSS